MEWGDRVLMPIPGETYELPNVFRIHPFFPGIKIDAAFFVHKISCINSAKMEMRES